MPLYVHATHISSVVFPPLLHFLSGASLSLSLSRFSQAHDRVMDNLKSLGARSSLQTFKNMRDVSMAVVENGGIVAPHPLGF